MKRLSNSTNIELAPNAKWIHESSAQVKIIQINGHTNSVVNCQLIDNDKKLFTVSNDLTARIWEFPSGHLIKVFPDMHTALVSRAKVSNDNLNYFLLRFISSSWDKTMKCWDIETGKPIWVCEHDYMVTYCDISSDNKTVLSVSDVDFKIRMWDARHGRYLYAIENLHMSTITTCKFLPKNDRLITTSMDKTCNIYDLLVKKTTITLNGHVGIVSNCAFTSDERMVVTSSWDKTLYIWDIATGSYRKNGPPALVKGHEGSISCCSFSKDGQLCVSGGYDGRLVLWEMFAEDSQITPKLILRGHPGWINDVAISSDNKRVVTVGKDTEIRVWNIENSDNIKVVIERNKHIGNKIISCTQCLRTFAVTKLQKKDTKVLCVFCRLQEEKLTRRTSLFDTSEPSLRSRKDSLINQIDSNLLNALNRRRESLIDTIDQNSINLLRSNKSVFDPNDPNAITIFRNRRGSIYDTNEN